MNNAELIKALRYCPSHGCEGCVALDANGVCTGHGIVGMMNSAADLIEAQQARIAELEAQIPKEGEWMVYPLNDFMGRRTGNHRIVCKCGYAKTLFHNNELPMFCENCGTRMRKGEQE